MNTFLSDNDEALKKDFERFAQDKLAPIASALASRKQNLTALLKQMAEAGYLALNVPTEYGGKDGSFLHIILLAEALAHYEVGPALSLAYHTACIELIKQYGSNEQKNLYLPKLASGRVLGTIAHLAEQEKTPVVLNEFPPTCSLILAFTGDNFLFLSDHDQKKLSENKISMGLQSVYFANLNITENTFNKNEPLGANESSSKNPEKLNFARNIIKTILAAAAVGMSQSVLNQSVAHTKIAKRDGKPLAHSEAIQWKLADLSVEATLLACSLIELPGAKTKTLNISLNTQPCVSHMPPVWHVFIVEKAYKCLHHFSTILIRPYRVFIWTVKC